MPDIILNSFAESVLGAFTYTGTSGIFTSGDGVVQLSTTLGVSGGITTGGTSPIGFNYTTSGGVTTDGLGIPVFGRVYVADDITNQEPTLGIDNSPPFYSTQVTFITLNYTMKSAFEGGIVIPFGPSASVIFTPNLVFPYIGSGNILIDTLPISSKNSAIPYITLIFDDITGGVTLDGAGDSVFGIPYVAEVGGELATGGLALYSFTIFGTGGIDLNSSIEINTATYNYNAVGGITIDGFAAIHTVYDGNGGITTDGIAFAGIGINGIGGITTDGTSFNGIGINTIGGIITSGTGSPPPPPPPGPPAFFATGSGGIVIEGQAFPGIGVPGSGGISAVGQAFPGIGVPGSGGATTDGDADESLHLSYIGVDGINLSGDNLFIGIGIIPSGGIDVTGQSGLHATYIYNTVVDDEATLGGIAIVNFILFKEPKPPYLRFILLAEQLAAAAADEEKSDLIGSDFRNRHEPGLCIAEKRQTEKLEPCESQNGTTLQKGAWLPNIIKQRQNPYLPKATVNSKFTREQSNFVKVD